MTDIAAAAERLRRIEAGEDPATAYSGVIPNDWSTDAAILDDERACKDEYLRLTDPTPIAASDLATMGFVLADWGGIPLWQLRNVETRTQVNIKQGDTGHWWLDAGTWDRPDGCQIKGTPTTLGQLRRLLSALQVEKGSP